MSPYQPPPNPLAASHYDVLSEALRHVHNARQMIGMAQQAGLNTDTHTALADHLEGQLTAMRNTYFPKGKPKP